MSWLALLVIAAVENTTDEVTLGREAVRAGDGRSTYVGLTVVDSALPGSLFVTRVRVDGVEVDSGVAVTAGDLTVVFGSIRHAKPRPATIELTGQWTVASPSHRAGLVLFEVF